ncbi:MAG: 50S ribosomal protein L9 [Deltaproteobacteria bacterium]|nr:50S ribosomal protein L9 [Deltaproteobacteria bacterium]
MKLILRNDVENLGRYGDTVKVAPGYGRNYLIPKGLAMPATVGNLRQLEAERSAYLKKAEARRAAADEVKSRIETLSLRFTRKAGEDGKLFGSVTTHDIEGAIKAEGYEIERRDLALAEPIKTVGEFTVAVKLHPDVQASIKVTVAAEQP